MSTFGWSYKSNATGSKRPGQQVRKVEEWQESRSVSSQPLHPQSHSAESLTAGKKDRRLRYDPRAKLYIGNLHWDTTERTLAQNFSTFGEIEHLKIIKDHETGSSRGFGFVTFADADSASEAKKWCAYNHLQIDGRKISVKSAERHTPKVHVAGEKRKLDSRKGPTLYWEYKWSGADDAEVYGPFETNLMLEWSKAGYFASGCWVRQKDPHALGCVADDDGDDEGTHGNKRPKAHVSYSDSSDSDEDTPSSCSRPESNLSEGERSTVVTTSKPDEVDDTASRHLSSADQTDPHRPANDVATAEDISLTGVVSTENVANDDGGFGGKDSAAVGVATEGATTEYYTPGDTEFVHISEIDFAMFP